MPRKKLSAREQREALAELLSKDHTISTEEKLDWVRSLSGEVSSRKRKRRDSLDWLQSQFEGDDDQKLKREEVYSRRRYNLVLMIGGFVVFMSILVYYGLGTG